MPRPKTKDQLLDLSQSNFVKLNQLIGTLPDDGLTLEFPKGTLNRNVKDVLAHLYEWHLMTLKWYEVGMKGEKPIMPAEGYTWKTLPDLNRKIWEENKDIDGSEAVKNFNNSHARMRKLINSHTNEELFEKKRYKWTGTTSVGAYLISSTSSHYDWAYKLIKKALKSYIARK